MVSAIKVQFSWDRLSLLHVGHCSVILSQNLPPLSLTGRHSLLRAPKVTLVHHPSTSHSAIHHPKLAPPPPIYKYPAKLLPLLLLFFLFNNNNLSIPFRSVVQPPQLHHFLQPHLLNSTRQTFRIALQSYTDDITSSPETIISSYQEVQDAAKRVRPCPC